MQTDEVSQRYAASMYELAESAKKVDLIKSQLALISSWLRKDPAGYAILNNPALSEEKKSKLLGAVADTISADKLIHNLIGVLARNGRTNKLAAISDAFDSVDMRRSNTKIVKVTSAVPLESGTRTALAKSLGGHDGAPVVFEENVDPALIGGLRIQIGSKLFDGSTATRLNVMKNAMRAG